MARKMTITRALAELKLYGNKIDSAIKAVNPIAIQKGKDKIQNRFTEEEFQVEAKASLQKIEDLIKEQRNIKAVIIKSNSTTLVKIGSEEMSVAEAIARKSTIQDEEAFLNTLREGVNTMRRMLEKEKASVQIRLDTLLVQNFGKDKRVDDKDVAAISKPFLEQNDYRMIDPVGIDLYIEKLNEKVQTFLMEVDFVLSESNAKTEIEV